MFSIQRKLLSALGIDRAIAVTVIGRGWLALAGLVGLALVGRYLSSDEQGYYFTFYSLLALQTFVEMGLTEVIRQFASHEAAHLSFLANGKVVGPEVARSRLASILRFSLRWYSVAAFALCVALIPGGFFFFKTFSAGGAEVAWQLPWIVLVLVAAGYLFITPIAAVLQGCGFVAEVAQFRLAQAIIAHTVLWGALWLKTGLWSATLFAATNLLSGVIWLMGKRCRHIRQLITTECHSQVNWYAEIWPYQWRIACSWLCGYFIFHIFTPIVFVVHGPNEAGRMGMSISIGAAVSAIGTSWLSTRAPTFGALVSLRRFRELDALFVRSTLQALCAGSACVGGVAVMSGILEWVHHPFTERILPTWPLTCLSLAGLVNIAVSAQATYLRSFKQEPFLIVSLTNAVLVSASACILAIIAGPPEIAIGYLFIDACVGLGLGSWVFQVKRRAWQHQYLECANASVAVVQPLACDAA